MNTLTSSKRSHFAPRQKYLPFERMRKFLLSFPSSFLSSYCLPFPFSFLPSFIKSKKTFFKLPSFVSQPHFGASVRMQLALPKVGIWSPSGLPKIQSLIAGVKTPCLEVFFIPLERSWSVNVQNGLAWAIWTFAAQVMVKRRAMSQIGSLTPDH